MRAIAGVVCLCVAIAARWGVAVPRAPARTWITDVTVISPERLDRVEVGSVLIEGERIVRVERGRAGAAPAGATVVSGHGQFLIPGLIDSHVHVASIPGMTPDQTSGRSTMVEGYVRQLPRSYLYYGYTTLIDLAVFDRQVLDDFRDAPLHPDLYDCGGSLPVANGYPMSFALPARRFSVFPNFLYDSAQAASIPPQYRPADHTPAADVARVKGSGGICVKTYFERGFGRDRNLPVMSRETFAAIRRAATQNGLVLMVHANSLEAQAFAVAGGADVLAHGMWHWGALDSATALPPAVRAVLDQIVSHRTGYQPTFQVLQGLRVYADSNYLKLTSIPKVIPRPMLAWFNSAEGQWFKREVVDEGSTDSAARADLDRGPIRRERLVVAYLARHDANFLFGTDTPSGPTYGNLPGLNGYLEMRQLQQAGLSLAQIFTAATIGNARAFKLDSVLGTIEPGKVANLLLLRQSPLDDVGAYDTITRVWVHGHAASREALATSGS